MKKKEKILKKREVGESLPEDLKKEYKQYLYNEQVKDFDRKVTVMHNMKESMRNEPEDFKTRMKSSVEIDHQKAKKEADISRDRKIDQKIMNYIKGKGLNVNDVKIVIKSGHIQLIYINESGEINREDVDLSKLQEK